MESSSSLSPIKQLTELISQEKTEDSGYDIPYDTKLKRDKILVSGYRIWCGAFVILHSL